MNEVLELLNSTGIYNKFVENGIKDEVQSVLCVVTNPLLVSLKSRNSVGVPQYLDLPTDAVCVVLGFREPYKSTSCTGYLVAISQSTKTLTVLSDVNGCVNEKTSYSTRIYTASHQKSKDLMALKNWIKHMRRTSTMCNWVEVSNNYLLAA